MKSTYRLKTKNHFLILLIGLMLTVLAPVANAITKHLSMIGQDGLALKSTLITIVSPDGSSTVRVTDDKGILQHDFKYAGTYSLKDPSGYLVKTISVAGSGLSKGVMIGVGAGAAALLLLAAGSSSGDTNNNPQAGLPTDPGAGDPGTGEPGPSEPGQAVGSIAGTYNVTAAIASNAGNLPVLIDNLVLQLEVIGTALTIIQTSNNSNFPSQLTGTIVDTAFTASASGNYGETATLFQLAGSVTVLQGLSFLINIGSDGTLEGGQALIYNASGTK